MVSGDLGTLLERLFYLRHAASLHLLLPILRIRTGLQEGTRVQGAGGSAPWTPLPWSRHVSSATISHGEPPLSSPLLLLLLHWDSVSVQSMLATLLSDSPASKP